MSAGGCALNVPVRIARDGRRTCLAMLGGLVVLLAAFASAAAQENPPETQLRYQLMLGLFAAYADDAEGAFARDLELKQGEGLVVQVIEGGTADKAGIKRGDILVEVPKDLWRFGVKGEIAVRRGKKPFKAAVTSNFHQNRALVIAPAKGKTPRKLTVGSHKGAQYRSITAALTQALQGDTVVVGPGVYREQIMVPANVTVQGAGVGLTQIVSQIPLRIIGAANVSVSGVSLVSPPLEKKNARRLTVELFSATDVSLSACAVEASYGTLVRALNSRNVVVRDCALQGGADTIGVSSENTWSTLAGSHFNDLALAINIQGGGAVVSGNSFNGNQISVRAAFARTVMRDNVISGVQDKKTACLVAFQCQTRISGNTLRDCHFGLGAQGADAVIENNTFSQLHDAITIFGGNVRIAGNVIYRNRNNGIVIKPAGNKEKTVEGTIDIVGNTVSLNSRNGIRIQAAQGVRVTENVMEANAFGLSTIDSNLDVVRNTIIYQTAEGLQVRGKSAVGIEGNIIAFNRFVAAIDVDSNVELARNAVYGNIPNTTHPLLDGGYMRLDRIRMTDNEALRVRIFPAFDLVGKEDVELKPEFVALGKDYGLKPGTPLAKHAAGAGQIGAVPLTPKQPPPPAVLATRIPAPAPVEGADPAAQPALQCR